MFGLKAPLTAVLRGNPSIAPAKPRKAPQRATKPRDRAADLAVATALATLMQAIEKHPGALPHALSRRLVPGNSALAVTWLGTLATERDAPAVIREVIKANEKPRARTEKRPKAVRRDPMRRKAAWDAGVKAALFSGGKHSGPMQLRP